MSPRQPRVQPISLVYGLHRQVGLDLDPVFSSITALRRIGVGATVPLPALLCINIYIEIGVLAL
ncbi:hypothetical protein BDN72DRAFT_832377 [Pluteus cervinus]|uniref:Uncharacterized protein n=1 Tax=Pluteus cervinus TaxID=181527 RepID=A0ACD3BAJ2_9AGAR|nr:hypothetical protein BDN72DRAFT_832377 [Pluteus cervinus]